ncbi:M50 family metallopeptidase [Portibacter marinus]|uniref:M50 family metallopeptidase n=1 Tax=Portibacter marinus TaxID=2898660 RepID=UPI001F2F7522|nr:M50 family metallopeptidase [Portibacter marinus]
MQVILGVLIGIAAIFGIVFSRIITTFIHELGHAIPALLLSPGKVTMYVGSDGDDAKSIKIQVGRLTILLSFMMWDLDIGLCQYQSTPSIAKDLMIVLGGPFLSLLSGSMILFFLVNADLTDGWIFVLSILMISSISDFLINIIPRKRPRILRSGDKIFNDGMQLVFLYQKRNLVPSYHAALELKKEGKNAEAIELMQNLTSKYPKKRVYWEEILDLQYMSGDIKAFLQTYDQYESAFDPAFAYVGQWAEYKIKLHDYDDVVKKLTTLIYEGKSSYVLHYYRGKALVELSEYHDAMRDFHALTLGEVEDPRALANRAYCQFRLGYKEEAREDVIEAVEHGQSHMGEIYFLAGVIFEDSDEQKALEFYKKSLALKYKHHALSFNISRIEK